MKQCSYCGRDNGDEAARCRECGTEFASPVEPPPLEPVRPEFELAPLSAADSEKHLVTVVNCRTLIAADFIVCRLRGVGIEAFIPDQYLMQAVGWNFNTYGYVRVQISPKDYDAARDILTETNEAV